MNMIDLETMRKQQNEAKHYVFEAVHSGKLAKPKQCEWCGSTIQIEGHHADYSKPLAVKWLCSGCHKRLHKGLRKALSTAKATSRTGIIENASNAKTYKKLTGRA